MLMRDVRELLTVPIAILSRFYGIICDATEEVERILVRLDDVLCGFNDKNVTSWNIKRTMRKEERRRQKGKRKKNHFVP